MAKKEQFGGNISEITANQIKEMVAEEQTQAAAIAEKQAIIDSFATKGLTVLFCPDETAQSHWEGGDFTVKLNTTTITPPQHDYDENMTYTTAHYGDTINIEGTYLTDYEFKVAVDEGSSITIQTSDTAGSYTIPDNTVRVVLSILK